MKLYQLRRRLHECDVLDSGDVGETDEVKLLSRELTARGRVEMYINGWGRVATVVRPLDAVMMKSPGAASETFAGMLDRLARGGKLW